MFQSTRPCGARPKKRPKRLERSKSFNPRARAGRDLSPIYVIANQLVSIHAPVRGATSSSERAIVGLRFQSTRPCGARPKRLVDAGKIIGFNPRARAGRDVHPVALDEASRAVSIHAPVRGATHNSLHPIHDLAVSIHAPVRGATGSAGYRDCV